MKSVNELHRNPAPAGRPQPLAFLGGALYVGSLDAEAIYEVDPATWQVRARTAAPGKPYGMALLGGALRVVISFGEEDDRYLYTFVPGKGFDDAARIALPDLSGSHLASDGSALYLLQIGKRRIVTLDERGVVTNEARLSRRLAGVGYAAGTLYGLAADEEFEHARLATVDARGAEALVTDIASISDEARGLTHDGSAWWTSYRDENQIGSFTA